MANDPYQITQDDINNHLKSNDPYAITQNDIKSIAPSQSPVRGAIDAVANAVVPGLTPDSAYAALEGIDMGVKTVGTTLAKGITKAANVGEQALLGTNKLEQTGVSPKSVQNYYENELNTYNNDPSVQKHPLLAFAGNMAGAGVMSAPLFGAAGLGQGATAETLAGAVNNPIAKGAATYLGNAAENTAAGYLAGGVTPEVGQGGNLWSPSNANTGAIFGAATSVPQSIAQNFGNKTTNLENAYQSLDRTVNGKTISYNGTLSDKDIGQQGIVETAGKALSNSFLSRIPGLNLLIQNPDKMQQSPATQAKLQEMTGYFSDYINALAGDGGVVKAPQTIGRQLEATNQTFKNTVQTAFQDQLFPNAVKNNLDNVNVQSLQPAIENVLSNYSKYLPEETQSQLRSVINPNASDNMNLTDIMGKDGVMGQIWPAHLLQKFRENKSDIDEDMAMNNLTGLYNQFKTTLNNHFTNTPVETDYHTAATTAHAYHEFTAIPGISSAIDAVGQAKNNVNTFIGALLSPRASEEYTQAGAGALGNQGIDALSSISLNKAFISSLNPGESLTSEPTVNMDSFIKKVITQPALVQKLNQPNVQALSAMSEIMKRVQNNPEVPIRGLGYIVNNSPLKNLLINFNKSQNNPGMAQYIMNTVTRHLINAGIIVKNENK